MQKTFARSLRPSNVMRSERRTPRRRSRRQWRGMSYAYKPFMQFSAIQQSRQQVNIGKALLRVASLRPSAPPALTPDERGEVKAVLRPFADEAGRYDPDENYGDQETWDTDTKLTLRSLRAARAMLEKLEGRG